jgi:hypothetical protein
MRKPGITNELKHLVNLKLEHRLNVSEQQRLDSLLSGSEVARNYLRQMEEMDASLQKMAGSSPQTDISGKVMQRIREVHKPQQQSRSFSLPARLAMQSRPLLRYAAVLVVGVMIGSALMMVISTGKFPGDRQAAVGTIRAGGARVMTFGEDDWQLQMQSMVVDQTITLVLTAYAAEDVQVGVSFDPAVYRLIKAADISEKPAFSDVADDFSASGASDFSAPAPGQMVHFHVEGHNRYIMVLHKRTGVPDRPLQVEVFKNEIVIRKQEINIR